MGETILAAALRAGVPYPFGCQSGNCGACKSTLPSGEVRMSPYSEYALSKAEREQGLILACRAVPWSDCEVAWLEADDVAMHPLRQLDCDVVGVEPCHARYPARAPGDPRRRPVRFLGRPIRVGAISGPAAARLFDGQPAGRRHDSNSTSA